MGQTDTGMSEIPSRRDFIKAFVAASAQAVVATGQHVSSLSGGGLRWRKGILLSGLPKALSHFERFQIARDAGFQDIEAYTIPDMREAEEVKNAAEKVGMSIVSVMNTGNFGYPLSSGDPAVIDKAIETIRTSLWNAKLWGARYVTAVAGVVTPETGYRDAWTRSAEVVRRLIPIAQEYGVLITFEEVWSKFLLSPLEFSAFIDAFDTPWVRAHFDVGNVVIHGYPQDWIRTLGKRTVYVHLKDFDTKSCKFVELGDGDVDWGAVRGSLIETGYQGTVSPELFIRDLAHLENVSQRVDRLLAG